MDISYAYQLGSGSPTVAFQGEGDDNLHVFSTFGQGYSVIVLPGETTASTPAPEMLTISDSTGAGISNIGADNDAPVEYFNLQGFRVDGNNLSNGTYIRRQGAVTNKIIVK